MLLQSPPFRRRAAVTCLVALASVLVLLFLFHDRAPIWTSLDFAAPGQNGEERSRHGSTIADSAVKTKANSTDKPADPDDDGGDEVGLVVASTKQENATWIERYFPHWPRHVYVVDEPQSKPSVPKNKGRETMVYLTYIIDNYDRLPANVLFLHASRFAWHNDDPDYDGLPVLRNLRLQHLRDEGYVNLRCVHLIGCPAEIRPAVDEADRDPDHLQTKHVYREAFQQLLPGLAVPDVVAVSCCAQFAATRRTLRSRSRQDYVRWRDWLLRTEYGDDISGRIFEFLWHIIFGKPAVHCPPAQECYCKTFGICDVECSAGECAGRYILPQFATLPQGWPRKGWNQEDRVFNGPLD